MIGVTSFTFFAENAALTPVLVNIHAGFDAHSKTGFCDSEKIIFRMLVYALISAFLLPHSTMGYYDS